MENEFVPFCDAFVEPEAVMLLFFKAKSTMVAMSRLDILSVNKLATLAIQLGPI